MKLLSEQIEGKLFTDTQIMRKVIAATNDYIKSMGWTALQVKYIKGTYHLTNTAAYWITAKEVLQAATGLEFTHLSNDMAKPIKQS